MMALPGIATRLYTPESLALGVEVAFDGKRAHYLRSVLRLRVGEKLAVFNEREGEWLGELVRLDGSGARVRLLGLRRAASCEEARSGPWLFFPPIRKNRLDWLIEKGVELGVARFLPCLTTRTSVRRLDVARLGRLATAAAEQCERLYVPECEELLSLPERLRNCPASRKILCCVESGAARPISEAIGTCEAGQSFAVLVGPEGGFTDEERATFAACEAAVPVGLGPRLLRVETAALTALAVLLSLGGEARKRPLERQIDPWVFPGE